MLLERALAVDAQDFGLRALFEPAVLDRGLGPWDVISIASR